MKMDQLSSRERTMLRRSICPICNKEVTRFDDFQVTKMRVGRRVFTFYLHSECLLSSLQAFSSQLGEGGIKNEEAQSV